MDTCKPAWSYSTYNCIRLVQRTTNQQWSISFGGRTWVNIRSHSRRHSVPKTRNLSNVRRLGTTVKTPLPLSPYNPQVTH